MIVQCKQPNTNANSNTCRRLWTTFVFLCLCRFCCCACFWWRWCCACCALLLLALATNGGARRITQRHRTLLVPVRRTSTSAFCFCFSLLTLYSISLTRMQCNLRKGGGSQPLGTALRTRKVAGRTLPVCLSPLVASHFYEYWCCCNKPKPTKTKTKTILVQCFVRPVFKF